MDLVLTQTAKLITSSTRACCKITCDAKWCFSFFFNKRFWIKQYQVSQYFSSGKTRYYGFSKGFAYNVEDELIGIVHLGKIPHSTVPKVRINTLETKHWLNKNS